MLTWDLFIWNVVMSVWLFDLLKVVWEDSCGLESKTDIHVAMLIKTLSKMTAIDRMQSCLNNDYA